MTVFEQSGALPAAVVAIGFAVLARALGAVSDGGALAGAVIAFLLIRAGGLAAFLPLVTVFVVTWLATRWRAERKRNLGVAERRGGRAAAQVLANLGSPGICALAAMVFPRFTDELLIGAVAALAEAAADTVSSEVGQAVETQPRMILGFRPAPVGTNGAISLEGTLGGCIAASMVAWTAAFIGVMEWKWAPVVALAAVAGMLFDSVLGAAFENDGKLGNNSVNFVSTIFAADFALLAAFVLGRV